MHVVESADGTIKIIELDPTKQHLIIVDEDAVIGEINLADGAIIIKRPGSKIKFVEHDGNLHA